MSPLVTIIIPTYNRVNFLHEAIDSVLAQTFTDYEIVVIDDGSTDTTYNMVKKKYHDVPVKYIWQENQGQSVARNKGISLAEGDFICFLDSDDKWYPDKLEKQLAVFASHPEVDLVYGDMNSIDRFGRLAPIKPVSRYSGYILKQLLQRNFIPLTTTMIRRKALVEIGGFNEENRIDEDYELWLKLSIKSHFFYLPGVIADYRIDGYERISNNIEARIQSNKKLIERIMHAHPELISAKERRDILAIFYISWGYSVRNNHCYRKAFQKYITAIRYNPMSLNAYRSLLKTVLLGIYHTSKVCLDIQYKT